MKGYALSFLRFVLKYLARLTVWRYRPGVIAVSGSVGKTSTRLAIATVIGAERSVRTSRMNFNNELGVPLVILSDADRIRGIFFWPKVVLASLWRLIVPVVYPEILVLEYGIDRPGDMRHLISIARPNVGVLTAIGEIPVHVEFFDGPDALAREKVRLIESLPVAGYAVLNYDNDIIMDLRERTRAHVVTFGFGDGADVRITDFTHVVREDRPWGIRFTISYATTSTSFELASVFGRSYAYAMGAAAATGLAFGMTLPKIMEALKSYKPAGSRMELIQGQKDTLVLNDAYNASPISMQAALETLRELPAKRKVAVLGDMRELGKFTWQAHETVGIQVASVADMLVTIGPQAKFIAEGAHKAKMRGNKIFSYADWGEALLPFQDMMRKGDLILVKASHGVHLEELVNGISASPKMPED